MYVLKQLFTKEINDNQDMKTYAETRVTYREDSLSLLIIAILKKADLK